MSSDAIPGSVNASRYCIVTFIVEPQAGDAGHAVWAYLPGPDQFAMMRTSMRRFHPNARFVILTDHRTQFPDFGEDVDIRRFTIDKQNLMFERLRLQTHFLVERNDDAHVVFLDSDIISTDSLKSLYDQRFDIALTVRDDESMPINAGAIFIHGDGLDRARAFFEAWLDRLATQSSAAERHWYGDQTSLYSLVQDTIQQSKLSIGLYETNELSLLLVDSKHYNYSPSSRHDLIDIKSKNINLVHFNGIRRGYMKLFMKYKIYNYDKKMFNVFTNLIFLIYARMEKKRIGKLMKSDAKRTRLNKY